MSRATERVPPTPATILVADDDDDLRVAVRKLLVAEGYAVIETRDGDSTLELLAAALERGVVPDALLLDFTMPGYSGLGILRALRRIARLPPTVLMTGFPDPSVELFARSVGVMRVLHKPVDADVLLAAVLDAVKLSIEERARRAR